MLLKHKNKSLKIYFITLIFKLRYIFWKMVLKNEWTNSQKSKFVINMFSVIENKISLMEVMVAFKLWKKKNL
jgi:hypothetical protein